jgi:hypothetical protein
MSKEQRNTFEISNEDIIDPTTVTINPYWLEAQIPLYKKVGVDPARIEKIEKNVERLKVLFSKTA